MEAFLQGDLIDGFESVIEQLANHEGQISLLPVSERVRQHIEDLPPDFAALAPVPGGVCVMGAKVLTVICAALLLEKLRLAVKWLCISQNNLVAVQGAFLPYRS